MSFQEDKFLDTSLLNLEGEFDAQVKQLLGIVRLTRGQVEDLHRLIEDVQNVLSNDWQWQGCMVHPFGSIVTGLGIQSSDVDCYVSLPRPSSNRTVYKARALLQTQPHLFTQLEAIARAKVPIVKCFHIPTRRYCDISFSSLSGVQNSKLLAYLLHVDKRALPLAIILKYWSKVHRLTGTNLLPNYALTLMVIFFLQVRNIVPSVYLLQAGEEEFLIDKWNSAFTECPSNFHDNIPNDTLFDLLGGFFAFYSNFDFKNEIISPFLGRSIPKEQFKSVDQVPKEFVLYKQNQCALLDPCPMLRIESNICVQDPFQHCRNCSVAVSIKLMNTLINHFKKCSTYFEESKQDGSQQFLKQILRIDEDELFPSLAHTKPINPIRGPHPNKIRKRQQRNYVQHPIKRRGFLLMYNQYRQQRMNK